MLWQLIWTKKEYLYEQKYRIKGITINAVDLRREEMNSKLQS